MSQLALKANDGLRAVARQGLQFFLPVMPVPLSSCFKNAARNGRTATVRYMGFKRAVDWHVHFSLKRKGSPNTPLFSGPVRVHYVISRPDKRRRDLDNLLKCLNDTLTRNFILGDDDQIVDLRIGWTLEKLEHPVLVQVEAVQ